jgi:hypothetical protein
LLVLRLFLQPISQRHKDYVSYSVFLRRKLCVLLNNDFAEF